MLDDLLGDPFLQNIFGATVPKNINVTSPETSVQRAAAAGGGQAAGLQRCGRLLQDQQRHFRRQEYRGRSPHAAHARERQRQLRSRRQQHARRRHQWKTYQPKAAFNPADPVGFKGEKIFEQPLIASQPGTHIVPALSFSFFDPATRRYETAHTSPLSVIVAPSVADRDGQRTCRLPRTRDAGTPKISSHGLRPDHAASRARVESLVPPYFQPLFLASLRRFWRSCSEVPGLRCAAASAMRADLKRQRERERSQMSQVMLEANGVASARGDAAAFFTSARSRCSRPWARGGRSRAPCSSPWPMWRRSSRGPVTTAVSVNSSHSQMKSNYSGGKLQAADFERWTALVRRQWRSKFPR